MAKLDFTQPLRYVPYGSEWAGDGNQFRLNGLYFYVQVATDSDWPAGYLTTPNGLMFRADPTHTSVSGIGAEVDACKAEADAFEWGAVSPSKAKAEMDDAFGAYGRFNGEVVVSKASDKFKASWSNFYDQFLKWYHDNYEGFTNWLEHFMTSGDYKKSKEYQCRLREWRKGLLKEDPKAVISEPEHATKHAADAESVAKWVAAGLIGAGLLTLVFRK